MADSDIQCAAVGQLEADACPQPGQAQEQLRTRLRPPP